MKALIVKQPGGPEVLELADVPDPQPGPDDLLVQVRAAGVNRADLLQRMGRYPPPPGESEIIGLEIAGEVVRAAGEFREGDRVMALLAGGGYATMARVPAAQAMRIPEELDFAEAAAVPEAFLTAWLNLFMLGDLQPGAVVVVHAGASGVGSAALQLCRGVASVVLASASPAKHEACRRLGATHVLARDEVPQRLAEGVRGASGGRGADLIFDLVGAAYLEANIAALALQGKLCCISTMSGGRASLDLNLMLRQRLTVLGSTLRTRSAQQKAKLVRDFSEKALHRFDKGELAAVVARKLPLAEAGRAHEALQRNEVVGKIVLITLKSCHHADVPRTVLIVDDSPTIRGFAKIYLKQLQVEIAEAEEGLQALELVRQSVPAVAVVDINMPGMDGLTFIRELRADARPEVARLPVILLTGDRSEEIRRKGREAGATDFIEKPIKGAELQAVVKRFL